MKTLLVLAVFAVVVLVFFSNVIFGGRVLLTYNPALDDPWYHYADQEQLNARSYMPDAFRTYLPRRVELSRSVLDGRLPLWNPYIFCGTPFFADPQSRVLYPISLLLVPVDPMRAMGYDIAIHFFLAMTGMYLFLKKAGSSALGAMLGGFSYGFSSFFFSRIGHPTFVASAAWLPFMLYGFEVARDRERLGTLLLAAFLVMGYLAGFPQVFLFGVTALVFYAAWASVEGALHGGGREIIRNARIIMISGVVSALVVCVQLVPFWEYAHNSVGLGYSFETMAKVHLWNPVLLIRSIVPNFFGNPADGTSWLVLLVQGVSHENTGFFVYCGVGSFLLACGSLAFITRSMRIRVLLAILLLSVGIGTSPLFLRAAYAVLPYIKYSKVNRISVLTCFSLSALAGLTFSMALRSKEPDVRRRFAGIVTAAAVIVLAACVVFVAMRGAAVEKFQESIARMAPVTWEKPGYSRVEEWLGAGSGSWLAFELKQVGRAALYTALSWAILLLLVLRRRDVRRPATTLGLILVLCVLSEVAVVARSYYVTQRSDVMGETEGIRFLRQALGRPGEWRVERRPPKSRVLPPNTGEVFRIPFSRGLATLAPDACFPTDSEDTSEGLGSARRNQPGAQTHMLNLRGTRYLISPSRGAPVSLPGCSLVYDNDMRVYENPSALERGICLPKSAVAMARHGVENVLEVDRALTGPHIQRCGNVQITAYEPEYVALSVTAHEACFVVFQDTYYPGWEAYIDGEERSLIRTDVGFRAIEVDAGEHRIVMKYRPASLRIGTLLACVGVLAGVLYLTGNRLLSRLRGPVQRGK